MVKIDVKNLIEQIHHDTLIPRAEIEASMRQKQADLNITEEDAIRLVAKEHCVSIADYEEFEEDEIDDDAFESEMETQIHGGLVKYGVTACYNYEDGYGLYQYRLPFDANFCLSWKEECRIHPQDPCPTPSLLLEFECSDGPNAQIFFGEPNPGRLTGDEQHWKKFWGGYCFTASLSLEFNLFQYFLLMKAYAIQVIHLGLDTFRKVRALMQVDFKELEKFSRWGKIQDYFYVAFRQFDPPRADIFARELAWNYIQTMTIDNFNADFAHLETIYGFVDAFLKDEDNLLHFLHETRSHPFRDALRNLSSPLPPKVLHYLNHSDWLRKKQRTGWRPIKMKMR